jgi:hypothetical protein
MAAKKHATSGIAAIEFIRLIALLAQEIDVVFVAAMDAIVRDGCSG